MRLPNLPWSKGAHPGLATPRARRRRLLWPLLILVTGAVVYLIEEAEPAPRPTTGKKAFINLNTPGMELRAGPGTPPAVPPQTPPTPDSKTSTAPPTGR